MNKPLRLRPADLPLREVLTFRLWRRRVPRFLPLRFMLAGCMWKRR